MSDLDVLADEIIEMARVDQEMRRRWADGEPFDPSIDARHTARLREVIDQVGWPSRSKVGEQAAHMAWLLAQHADRDRSFQEGCLAMMKALPPDEVAPADIAYLEDRVRVGSGRPQLYGTQFRVVDGKVGPQPIEDPDHLDERRAAAGLGPFEEYRQLVEREQAKASAARSEDPFGARGDRSRSLGHTY